MASYIAFFSGTERIGEDEWSSCRRDRLIEATSDKDAMDQAKAMLNGEIMKRIERVYAVSHEVSL